MIQLDLGGLATGLKIGESISVNGVCLTITRKRGQYVLVEVIEETLRVTTLGELVEGSKANVERALRLSGRLDGHLVTGHVDGTGKVAGLEQMSDRSLKLWVQTGNEIAEMMIRKGSVALDGVSLTIVDTRRNEFSVCLIPRTISMTTLGHKKVGDWVNIEVDMIGKYVKKFTEQIQPGTKGT